MALGERDRARAGGVVLRPYDPIWPIRFEEARRGLLEACGGLLVAVEHVGSTAVPGLGAKPYLDLMPGLRRYEDGPGLVEPLAALGYVYRGEYGIRGRHYFNRQVEGDPHVWKHNVHAFAVGHYEWERHLVFRDALRADPALRDQYWAVKVELASRHVDDVEAYAEAKSAFVERVIAAAGGPPRPPEEGS